MSPPLRESIGSQKPLKTMIPASYCRFRVKSPTQVFEEVFAIDGPASPTIQSSHLNTKSKRRHQGPPIKSPSESGLVSALPDSPKNIDPDNFEAQVIVGVISCTLGSGIVFGFAALKPILVDRQAYRDLCTKEELQHDFVICYKQDLKYDHHLTMVTQKY